MKSKIVKVSSKWIVESGSGEIFEFDNLPDAEKKCSNMNRAEGEGYVIRQDYQDNKLISETLIG